MRDQSTRPCACGCGTQITLADTKGRPHFFVRGHHNHLRWRPRLEGLCACGCGQTLNPTRYRRGARGFIKGHVPLRPLADRLWEKVEKTDDCWLWTGAQNLSGYGRISRGGHDGPQEQAHRVAWELASGEIIPADKMVGHTCDVPNCVRNDGGLDSYIINGVAHPRYGHLWLGTKAENTADMFAKGRDGTKVTADIVRAVRAAAASGERNAALALAFGLERHTVTHIVARTTWKHVH